MSVNLLSSVTVWPVIPGVLLDGPMQRHEHAIALPVLLSQVLLQHVRHGRLHGLCSCNFRDTGNLLLQLLVDTFHSRPDVVPRSRVILACSLDMRSTSSATSLQTPLAPKLSGETVLEPRPAGLSPTETTLHAGCR